MTDSSIYNNQGKVGKLKTCIVLNFRLQMVHNLSLLPSFSLAVPFFLFQTHDYLQIFYCHLSFPNSIAFDMPESSILTICPAWCSRYLSKDNQIIKCLAFLTVMPLDVCNGFTIYYIMINYMQVWNYSFQYHVLPVFFISTIAVKLSFLSLLVAVIDSLHQVMFSKLGKCFQNLSFI